MTSKQSELIVGMTQTVGENLHLYFDTYQAACDAAEVIDQGGIRRVIVETTEGQATVWCNYVAWVRVLRNATPITRRQR